MLSKISGVFRKLKWTHVLLFVIITMGIFLRTYHFSDWLLFEIDQTYDTRIVSRAIEQGIGNLPLLGPTAGGGRALRLGPAFYYMEYISALVFGDTPTGHAMLVLVLSILSLPLFYLFCRRYFTVPLALALLTLFSGSFYLVLYGRFSWSPNVLPFLILLSFYALLRSIDITEPNRNRYFLLATTAIGITSQIHFNAFFTIPTIAVLFLLYKRPRFPWKTWALAFGIIALIYSPMMMNDIITHGENIHFFLSKASKGGSSNLVSGFIRKSVVDLQYTASNTFLVVTGIDHISGGRLKGYGLENGPHLLWRLDALILFFAGLILLCWNIFRETQSTRKDFLILVFLWTTVPIVYFYSLISGNFQIYPRFALLTAPVAFILFGMLFEKLQPKKSILRYFILTGIILLLLALNLMRVASHFSQLAHPTSTPNTVETEDIFPNNKRLTLQESLTITDYLLTKQKENGYPLYIDSYHEYEPTFWYLLEKRGLPYYNNIDFDALYAEGNYFLIQYPDDGKTGIEKVFDIEDRKDFGALTVYTLFPETGNVKMVRQTPESRTTLEQTRQIQALKTWNDLLR